MVRQAPLSIQAPPLLVGGVGCGAMVKVLYSKAQFSQLRYAGSTELMSLSELLFIWGGGGWEEEGKVGKKVKERENEREKENCLHSGDKVLSFSPSSRTGAEQWCSCGKNSSLFQGEPRCGRAMCCQGHMLFLEPVPVAGWTEVTNEPVGLELGRVSGPSELGLTPWCST